VKGAAAPPSSGWVSGAALTIPVMLMHRVAQGSALWGDTPACQSNSATLCRFRPSGANGIYDGKWTRQSLNE
jgi:hypothetical protein